MKHPKLFAMLVATSLLPMLTACGTPDGGYYDSHGNYIPTSPVHQGPHSPLPGGPERVYSHDGTDEYGRPAGGYTVYKYDRAGYYDYNGYYIPMNRGPAVPADMLPPRGMCRVWFTDRAPANQPSIEPCDNIRARVPAGAYVIYGG